MPKLNTSNPKYRRHRASGQAVVTLCGQDFYLGPHGSKSSRQEYDRLVGEWRMNGRAMAPGEFSDLAVSELIGAYWKHAQEYHASESGGSDGEMSGIKLALRETRKLYGKTMAVAFGPIALASVRQAMVKLGWSRTYVNAQVMRIRRMFRWAVSKEMVPSSVPDALKALDGLRVGKTTAPETEPVTAVALATIDATLPHLSQTVRDMVELQQITAMRPAELCAMRWCDVDVSANPWEYKPATHKNAHRKHARIIYLGARCQLILNRHTNPNLQAPIFSPAKAEAERRQKAHAARVADGTPLSCGNRPGSNVVRKPKRAPGEKYSVDTYRRAIARACEKAFVMPAALAEPRTEAQRAAADMTPAGIAKRATDRAAWRRLNTWCPYQLRHTRATELRREFGLEAAQVILGHKTLTATQIYAEKNVAAAQKIMGEVG